ncbi:CD44 antigen isoform X2 [Pithys albifrons albifrons]|uniref:CD44 antigen isoform X2 n=1 Tax=Pithys albifrons albifrons TaxID=3385563 RepID=UPI003A5CFFF1
MASFSLWTAFGLCLLKLCLTETQFNVSCRYGGVFHVEKNGRYSLTRPEAVELCRALNSTLATLEQLRKAHDLGFETCRYGFVVGHVVIPRINPYPLCAANHTGIYIRPTNTTGRFDAYCYNETETRDIGCEPIEKLDTSLLSNQDEIVIDNADGSRYNADGTRHISGESSTSGADDENVDTGSTHETTPMDASIMRSSPSYYGGATPVSQLPDHTSGEGEKGIPGKDYDDETASMSPDISLGTVTDDFHEEDGGLYHATTTPGPRHDDPEKATTRAWWNPFSDHWWWSNPGEKIQEPTQATKADVTSSGNGSDDEDSSEETMYPTVFPGWSRSEAKDDTAPSMTPGPRHDDPEKATTRAWWNPFSDHWWWSNPGEKIQEPTQATKDVTSSGNGSDDEDSSEETMYPTVFPGWGSSVAKDDTAPSMTVDSQHETPLEIYIQDHWNSTFTGEEEQYPSSAILVTSENEKHAGPTQHPLLHSVHSGGISREQNPASTTVEQHEFTVAGENYFVKESSPTAMVSHHGVKQNDSEQDPLLYPGWDDREDYATQTATLDRITPSRGNNRDQESSTTESMEDINQEKTTNEPLVPGTPPGRESEQANTTDGSRVSWIPEVLSDTEDHFNRLQTPLTTTVASPDDAHHKDPTQAPVPSDNETRQGSEGITNPTDTPGDEVLHRTTASMIKADNDSSLTGTAIITTVPASTNVLVPEDATQEIWATRVVVTAVASPDGAHHKDPTQAPLPSDNEPGQGSESITNPTDVPRDEVFHRTTASMVKADNDSPLIVTESVEDVNQEKTTKKPLVPGTPSGREREKAMTTDSSHVSWIPEVFPDIEDHLNRLQTPLTTSSTSGIYGDEGPRKGPYESTTFHGETTTPKVDSQPRSAHVPDWLIIVAALVALALVLGVCIAVNSRRCGQKKKLVINNGKGAVEDRKTSALNGDISKSQEMVHLVHKEQSNDRTQACDEFLTVNETQNHQELDMKTGV